MQFPTTSGASLGSTGLERDRATGDARPACRACNPRQIYKLRSAHVCRRVVRRRCPASATQWPVVEAVAVRPPATQRNSAPSPGSDVLPVRSRIGGRIEMLGRDRPNPVRLIGEPGLRQDRRRTRPRGWRSSRPPARIAGAALGRYLGPAGHHQVVQHERLEPRAEVVPRARGARARRALVGADVGRDPEHAGMLSRTCCSPASAGKASRQGRVGELLGLRAQAPGEQRDRRRATRGPRRGSSPPSTQCPSARSADAADPSFPAARLPRPGRDRHLVSGFRNCGRAGSRPRHECARRATRRRRAIEFARTRPARS